MMLGAYPFMLDTAAYQKLKRVSTYRWKQKDRIGRKPGQQFVGSGADQITLSGEILPTGQADMASSISCVPRPDRGKPLVLLVRYGGIVLGDWVILKIDETKSELEADGAPRVIVFSITLKEYGGAEAGFGDFGCALATLSTIARLT